MVPVVAGEALGERQVTDDHALPRAIVVFTVAAHEHVIVDRRSPGEAIRGGIAFARHAGFDGH
jgi:hypothetical protein